MDTKNNADTKIVIGDLEFWTRPWGKNKAVLTANEAGTNRWLYNVHKAHPEIFEILQDDEDFCPADLEGTFSIIVDPEKVGLWIGLGNAGIGFRVSEDGDTVREENVNDE